MSIVWTLLLCAGILLLIGLTVKFLIWLFKKATGRPTYSRSGSFVGDFFDDLGDCFSGGGDSGGGDSGGGGSD